MAIQALTPEFLSKILKVHVTSVSESSGEDGANVGVNLTTSLYPIRVSIERKPCSPSLKSNQYEEQRLIVKCFPSNPGMQDYLRLVNFFHKEAYVYSELLPKLAKLKPSGALPDNDLGNFHPWAPCLYARAVNYFETKQETGFLDNCIVMKDLIADGYKLPQNAKQGLDLNHVTVAIAAIARFHGLGWVCKTMNNLDHLTDQFPALTSEAFERLDLTMFEDFTTQSINIFKRAIEQGVQDPSKAKNYNRSLDSFANKHLDVGSLYFTTKKSTSSPHVTKDGILRIPGKRREDERPWSVCVHGDVWYSNLLFKYDEFGIPVDVKLIDFQYVYEGDLCVDLAYFLYTDTTRKFRESHLNSVLQTYHHEFIKVCKIFNVAMPPQFELGELQRRFHRSKIMGFSRALHCLKLFVGDGSTEECVSMKSCETKGMQHLEDLLTTDEKEDSLNARIVELVAELYEEGVI